MTIEIVVNVAPRETRAAIVESDVLQEIYVERASRRGLAFWLITIGAGRFQPDMQPVEISRVNLQRMTHAVMDLDSFAALNKPGGDHVRAL